MILFGLIRCCLAFRYLCTGLAAVFLLQPSLAFADDLRPGYIDFTEIASGQWSLVWKAPMSGGITPGTLPILPSGCSIIGDPVLQRSDLIITARFDVLCKGDIGGKEIGLSGFDAAQTDVLIRVDPIGAESQALRITANNPRAFVAMTPGMWQVTQTYFVIGIEHILTGFDHLLFVIALLLLLGNGWPLVKAATAFTAAHSITLIGTIMGYIGVPQRPIEAVIALSIVFLATEIVKNDPVVPRFSIRLPWVVALIFGLLHGFGFAGALSEIGLPPNDIPAALLSFNIGVEAGQMLIILGGVILLSVMHRFAQKWMKPIILSITYAIGGCASFWFIERMVI